MTKNTANIIESTRLGFTDIKRPLSDKKHVKEIRKKVFLCEIGSSIYKSVTKVSLRGAGLANLDRFGKGEENETERFYIS